MFFSLLVFEGYKKIFNYSFIFLFFSNPLSAQRFEKITFPDELKNPISLALASYPNLKNLDIEFKFKKKLNNKVMKAQPKLSSFFRKKDKRSYKIVMSKELNFEGGLSSLIDVPENILIGWFAHELGHIMDYKRRSSMNLIEFGIKYLTSKRFLKKCELRADQFAIKKGLGQYIIQQKKYVLSSSLFSEEYTTKIKTYYPSTNQIISLMKD